MIDDLPNPIHRVFYEPLLFTDIRKTDVLILQWKQILEDRIHLPMIKNGRSFDLPILQLHHEILALFAPQQALGVSVPKVRDGSHHTTGKVQI